MTIARLRRLNRDLTRYRQVRTSCLIMVLLCTAVLPVLFVGRSEAAVLTSRSLQLSDYTDGDSGVTYSFSFHTTTDGPIGSVAFEVCSNYRYEAGDPCTAPSGFDDSAAVYTTAQPGPNDFTLQTPAANRLLLVRSVADTVVPQQLTFQFSGITNPATVGSYYVRMQTLASTDGNGTEVDAASVAFAINENIAVSTVVPPYLLFCTGLTIDNNDCDTAQGSLIDFGELSSTATRTATSQLLASTNAPYGYSVTLAGVTMTAGTNVIPAMSGGTSQVGTSQFGIDSRRNSDPVVGNDPSGPGLTVPSSGYDTPNQFRFTSGDIIASSDTSDDYRKLTMSYIVNVSPDQAPGNYVATISYICLANF